MKAVTLTLFALLALGAFYCASAVPLPEPRGDEDAPVDSLDDVETIGGDEAALDFPEGHAPGESGPVRFFRILWIFFVPEDDDSTDLPDAAPLDKNDLPKPEVEIKSIK